MWTCKRGCRSLSPEARAALARKIKAQLSGTESTSTDHDVAIVGGGVGALTLALEMRRARPHTRILIIEPNPHPVPEITHTVGESTVEIAAQYLRDRLGLADHLNTSQLRKMGLRMFFSHDGNTDIANGSNSAAPHSRPGHVPNRPRQAGERAQSAVPVRRRRNHLWPSPIRRTVLRGSSTQLSVQRGDTTSQTTARWVVDASGPTGHCPAS